MDKPLDEALIPVDSPFEFSALQITHATNFEPRSEGIFALTDNYVEGTGWPADSVTIRWESIHAGHR